MIPSAQCPQCAAPLPPGAPKCGFCGFVTPWGATLQNQVERASALQADQAKRVRIAKAESTARTGMILALVGLPICCAPLSLFGGAMGWRGAQLAKAEGIPRPITSVISMIVAVICSITLTTVIVMYKLDQQKKEDRLAEVRARLKGKRDAATLDAKVGCDLVEEHVAANGYGGATLNLDAVHCDGAFSTDGRRASLVDVRFNFEKQYFTVNACLEKRSRWFVMKLLDSGSCADLPPPAPFTAPARQMSDDEVAADETKARADLANAAGTVAIKQLTDKLAKVRAHAAGAGGEKVCSKADMSKYVTGTERRKVRTIDFDVLNGSRPADSKEWQFLTSEVVRNFLDEKRKVEDRVTSMDELRKESGPILVVYRSQERLWPKVTDPSKEFAYEGGEFSGWMFVYDVDSGERLCQTKIAFESSDEVSFKKSRWSSERSKLQEAVFEDFTLQFGKAGTDAIKRIAPDLRLGYLTVE